MLLREFLINYSNEVITGKVVACIKHKQACQRFLNEIVKEGTEEFPFYFDDDKGLRFIEWSTFFKHTKGPLQGQSISFEPIQIFIFGNIYGWCRVGSGRRRFKKAYWQVARKNAKTQSMGCVGSYECMANGVNMSEVYVAATKKEQANILYKEIVAQLKGCGYLQKKYNVKYGKINHLKSDSFITALSKDAGKEGDGFNPQCALIDEYHAHKTSEIYDVLVSGMGARSEPLIIIITTAGFELNYPCYSVEYKYVSQILDPENPIENDEYFVMINELDPDDDYKDESVWPKANPIVCTSEIGLEYLRGELKVAIDVPEKKKGFLTKNMNIWVDAKDNGYMDMTRWNACGDRKFTLEWLRGCEVIIGSDLSAKIDQTSYTIECYKNGKFYVYNFSFIPEETLKAKMKSDKVPYDLWVEQGHIVKVPGAVVDYDFVRDHMYETIKNYDLKPLEFPTDPWNAYQLIIDLSMDGFIAPEIRQGFQTLSGPTKNFREEVYKRNVVHNHNPNFSWSVSNAVTKQDSNENIMLDKAKSYERIDPIASAINAHVRMMAYVAVKPTDINKYTTDEYLDKVWS